MQESDVDPVIARAIQISGRQSDLAAKIGCAQQHVSKLLKRQITASAELAMKIEAATGIPAREIRPDLPWPSTSNNPSQCVSVS